ncbi:hypothetical protein N9B31_03890 [Mariniblastus sp.]|nr:hypothetical protein [Mariniblastus sp.]MDA7904342.1 hypothetical protein [bacterium]MDA7902780.1 hypothetical protein [Mariniblastus sp.]MDB4374411.1 hypothetical protein [bacterium]MDB4380202.1 hypothetical protein [Mariniblastus sp.]
MIKPLNSPQLSAAKNRTGLQSISDLLPRLIRQYEIQAEMLRSREEVARPCSAVAIEGSVAIEQGKFAWYE